MNSQKKIQHAFEESIFWSQTKGICNRRGKGFFSSTLGETKGLGTTKEQTKKEMVAFLFVSSQHAKANVFCFFILVKTIDFSFLFCTKPTPLFLVKKKLKLKLKSFVVVCFHFLWVPTFMPPRSNLTRSSKDDENFFSSNIMLSSKQKQKKKLKSKVSTFMPPAYDINLFPIALLYF